MEFIQPEKNPSIFFIDLKKLLPAQVNIQDLNEAGLIIKRSSVLTVQESFNGNSELKEFKIDNISVIRLGEQLYAIYPHMIGVGSFGNVYLMQNINSKQWEALKIITLQRIDTSNRKIRKIKELEVSSEDLAQEINNLKEFDYYLGHFIGSENKVYLGMRFVHGIPLNKMMDWKMSFLDSLQLIKAVLLAVQKNIFGRGYLHRDLRPPNIIFNPINQKVHIVDFGMTVKYDKGDYIENKQIGHPRFIGEANQEILSQQSSLSLTFNELTELYAVAVTLNDVFNLRQFSVAKALISSEGGENATQKSLWSFSQKNILISIIRKMKELNVNFAKIIAMIEQHEAEITPGFEKIGIINLEEIIFDGKIIKDFISPLCLLDKVYLLYPKNKLIEGKNIGINSFLTELIKVHNIKVSGVVQAPFISKYSLAGIVRYIGKDLLFNKSLAPCNIYYITSHTDLKKCQNSVNIIWVEQNKTAEDYEELFNAVGIPSDRPPARKKYQ